MRSVGVGVLCFVLGVLLMLLLREAPKPAPPPPECPPPVACPVCPSPAAATAATHAARPPRHVPRAEHGPVTAPLPQDPDDADAHRDRLREWFETEAPRLADCVARGEPRRQLLLQMKIEPDGKIGDASLLGATDLPRAAQACVVGKVRALVVPREDLRGRETLVVHVSL